jgi:hypothetical protein
MKKQKLIELYNKYQLTKEDVFNHQHYIIITRTGIEKIQAVENIHVKYEVINCQHNFVVIKATGYINTTPVMETFGSALKGKEYKEGNTNSWYVTEMAEKRALSRVILKLTGFYALGVFGEDESEDFKINN